MPAEFIATADQLSSIAAFLRALSLATHEHGPLIGNTFPILAPGSDNNSFIDARWDEASSEYVLHDTVGAG
jgi:hypothetical protein